MVGADAALALHRGTGRWLAEERDHAAWSMMRLTWLPGADGDGATTARRSALMRAIRSSKEPASARVGQALTRAPTGP